jgi:hypothetical protein
MKRLFFNPSESSAGGVVLLISLCATTTPLWLNTATSLPGSPHTHQIFIVAEPRVLIFTALRISSPTVVLSPQAILRLADTPSANVLSLPLTEAFAL